MNLFLVRLIPGLTFTSGAFIEILEAKDAMSISSCSSSADSEVWEHLRPSAQTAMLRAKHLHPRGFLCSKEGSGSLQGPQGGVRVTAGTLPDTGPTPAQGLLIILLSLPSRARLEAATARSWGQHSPTALPELQTYISPRPFSHSNRLLDKKLLCYWLDFVSSSLIYSPRQMPAFPCPALR